MLCDGEDETERTVQHDRGEQREAARGMASRNWICRVEYSAAPPGRPVWLPGPAPACLRRQAGRLTPASPASLAADRPRAKGAADAGGGPARSGHCPRIGGHPGHGQKHVGYVLGKLGTANRIESVARTRVLRLIPGRGPSQPRPGHYISTTARHQRRARLHLSARCSPEDSTRHVPFRGMPGPPDLPSVRRTERTPEGGSAMATAQPGPSNGGHRAHPHRRGPRQLTRPCVRRQIACTLAIPSC